MVEKQYIKELTALLSLEYNCPNDAWIRTENVLTESRLHEGRRMYGDTPYFFHMATMGGNAVITADALMHPFLSEYIEQKTGHWLFEVPHLLKLERELNRFSYTLTQSHHMFLPCWESSVLPRTDIDVLWCEDKEIHRFYGDERFPNAICPTYLPQRPDRIAVLALAGNEIVGMAGGSEDAPGWIQIGIDVIPQYRSRGIGTYLVMLLKKRIEEMGAIPFYGTSVSNYHSWNIAIKSGFRPTWVEIGAEKM